MNLNASEAKAHLGKYVAEAANGARFIICERNRPVAQLRGLDASWPQATPLSLGLLNRAFTVPPDFNEPHPVFERDYYGAEPPTPDSPRSV